MISVVFRSLAALVLVAACACKRNGMDNPIHEGDAGIAAQSAPPVIGTANAVPGPDQPATGTSRPEAIDSENAPKPFAVGNPDFSCTFANDFVGSDIPRRFFVELEIPKLDYPEITCSYDTTKIKLFGSRGVQTQFDVKGAMLAQARNVRRYYFESIAGARGKTEIRFALGDNAVVTPFVLWDYEDLRRPKLVNGVEFPRRYKIDCIKPPVVPVPPVGGQKAIPMSFEHRAKNPESFDSSKFTLDEVWSVMPDTAAGPRYGNGPEDPIHGKDVFLAGGAFCPYKQMLAQPGATRNFYLISPVDGRKIPDNDLANGDYTSGKWIDDGYHGIEINGERRLYAANHGWYRGPYAYHLARNLATNYTRTGDEKYLDLALVALCRIGVEHSYLAMMPNHRKTHVNLGWQMRLTDAVPMKVIGNPGFLIHGCGQPSLNDAAIMSYVEIAPHIEKSPTIVGYLQNKGFPVKNHEDVKRFLEQNVVHTAIQITLDGNCTTNQPMPALFFLKWMKGLSYPSTELLDIARDGDGTYFINGIMKSLMYNSMLRDGVNYESPGGYNGGKWENILDMAKTYKEAVDALPSGPAREKYLVDVLGPKMVTGMEAMIEHQPIGTTRLNLGDAGQMPVFGGNVGPKGKIIPASKSQYFGDENARTFAEVFKLYPDDKIAWALVNSGWSPPAGYPFTLEEMKSRAARLPENWRARGRLLSGLGISLNRSGIGEDERCLVVNYGFSSYPGHESESTMGLYLDAFGSKLITPWGYPPNWDSWYRSWFTQNTGRQYPPAKGKLTGTNDMNVDNGPIHVTDSHANYVEDLGDAMIATNPTGRYKVNNDAWQRRLNVLVDVSDKEFYVLDLYRMHGGKEHWRSMQTLDGAVESTGVDFKKQAGGTLAGENVQYDDKSWWAGKGQYGDRLSRPFTLLENVESGMASDAPWQVTWNIHNGDGLKVAVSGIKSDGARLHLADARCAQRSHEIVRRFLMTQHKTEGKEPLRSETLNLIQPFRGTAPASAVKYLPVEGGDERGFKPAGCVVKLASRTDYFILSASESTKIMILPNGSKLVLDGRIGYVSLHPDGSLKDLRLVAGTSIQYQDKTVANPVGGHSGKIVRADYANKSFDIAPPPASPDGLTGKHIHIKRGGLKFGMEIREATLVDGAMRVRVNCDPLLFIGTARVFEDGWVKYRTKKNLGSFVDVNVCNAYRTYHKTRMIGRSGKSYTVENIGQGGVLFEQNADQDTSAANLKVEFPEGSDLKVFDYGVGDEIEIPLANALK